MNHAFKSTKEHVQGAFPITILHLHGWLDAQSEPQLLETARLAYDEGARYLLLEMSELDTLTSAGMRAIQKLYQLFTPKDEASKVAHLKLCNAPPQIYNVLGLTGFLQNIPMYESMESALETFGSE